MASRGRPATARTNTSSFPPPALKQLWVVALVALLVAACDEPNNPLRIAPTTLRPDDGRHTGMLGVELQQPGLVGALRAIPAGQRRWLRVAEPAEHLRLCRGPLGRAQLLGWGRAGLCRLSSWHLLKGECRGLPHLRARHERRSAVLGWQRLGLEHPSCTQPCGRRHRHRLRHQLLHGHLPARQ